MRAEDFADVLGGINESYIQEAETMKKARKPVWPKWGAMAACFCLLAAAVAVAPKLLPGTTPPQPDNHDFSVPSDPSQSEDSDLTANAHTPWTIHFNEAPLMTLTANHAYYKGVFTEALNNGELVALMPSAGLDCSGYARFDNFGYLLEVVMQASTALPESPVTVSLADYYFGFDHVLSVGEVVSVCNGVEYSVYQYESGNQVELSAYSIINDIYFAFAMDVPQSNLEQAKEEFQRVLEYFAYYEEGKPDLSVITPEEIPELTEQIFNTLSEAQAEPDFGRYLPSELPAGFGDAAIRRFQFQNDNYLSAMWSKGLDDLCWVVDYYTEADANRLTSVNDTKNYDLSLYPIPRAESVPDELREMVDNPIFDADELTLEAVYCRAYKVNDAGDTDGWRMNFCVRYGEILVQVHTKGVDPEWVYQQLMTLNMR